MSADKERRRLLILEDDRVLARELEQIFADLEVTCSEASEQTLALGSEIHATLFGVLDEQTWERLEEALIMADVGAGTTASVVETLETEAAGVVQPIDEAEHGADGGQHEGSDDNEGGAGFHGSIHSRLQHQGALAVEIGPHPGML